jgi:hypothetical protein
LGLGIRGKYLSKKKISRDNQRRLRLNVEKNNCFTFHFSAKDENVRRIMKEIEYLNEDSSKLQQMLDIASNLRTPHQTLEESIRDLQINVQRQLAERQVNDSQLSVLELNVNGP